MPLTVHGKHFHLDGKPHFLRTVTYGPFPPNSIHSPEIDFPRIRRAGFNSIRVYTLPGRELLDAAGKNDLLVIASHAWANGCDFIRDPDIFREARASLVSWLAQYHDHPALGALLVGNEIPTDMARWMGPAKVRVLLDELILAAKKSAPALPVAYSNFPTTEYLEPLAADFTAFNLYLENPNDLADYLPRLHHLAGDRPVYLTEFGLDTQGNSEEQQAELLPSALRLSREAGLTGATLYAWSDAWQNNGETITDWSFGLVRRDGSEKPVLAELEKTRLPLPQPETPPRFSVIICTRNGADRLKGCLDACLALDFPDFEIIVVNDGSTDDTEKLLESTEGIRAFHLDPSGLSAARNYGAKMSKGEILAFTDDDCRPDVHWLAWLAHAFTTSEHAAIGGPNLAPQPDSLALSLTTAAPGAPTHVMLDDTTAEHLPGCHLSVRRSAFDQIGGFDKQFHTAGDDVDFCWRIRDAGHTLGFCGASFVWHYRRATPWRYLKQQMGYGKAEALLFKKHPQRFSEGGIRWRGCVYQGGALGIQPGDFIYSGPTGEAPYQSLALNRQPVRRLPGEYDTPSGRFALRILAWLQSLLRPWARKSSGGPGRSLAVTLTPPPSETARYQLTLTGSGGLSRHHLYRHLLAHGWEACPEPDWDLQYQSTFLIAATEQSGTRTNRTFVGLSGPAPDLKNLALDAGFILTPS